MYYAITFESKELKKSKIYITDIEDGEDYEDEEDNELLQKPEKMSWRERKAQKKQLEAEQEFNISSENVYLINGEEVAEEDLTKEERADIEANKLLNQDHFYDALEPVDWGVKTKTKRQIQPAYIIGGIVCGIIIVGIIAFAYISLTGL